MDVLAGSTDVTTYFQLSLLADNADATGLTIADIDLQYTRSGVAPTAKVDATALAATDSAHGDNKAIEIDATDQPGLYRVDWPDAAFVAGVREVLLTVKCALVKTQTLRVNLTPTPADVRQFGGTTGTFASGRPEVNTTHAAGTAWASGAIVSGCFAAGAITADAIATDAIGAVELAAGAVAEIQSGLATASSLATVAGDIVSILAAVDTEIATLLTLVGEIPTNAELATALATADDAVLAQVALVKAKTDLLSFTVTNILDVNVAYVNDIEVGGSGTEAGPWGPS